MANHRSAEKCIRRIVRQTAVNKNRVSRIRTFVKKVESLISSGKKAEAKEALQLAEGELMRGAQKGVIHPNAAARKISRLSKSVKGLSAA